MAQLHLCGCFVLLVEDFPDVVTVFLMFTPQLLFICHYLVVLSEDTKKPVSPEVALILKNKIWMFWKQTSKHLFCQGACILVTPEDGIYYGCVFTRETVYPYIEDIPDPQGNWIPCPDHERHKFCNENRNQRLSVVQQI
uniref:Uncharacterized protein n=1 Tax=Pelusios castaneus TaxID=367368 RepID=A0A8C8SUM6_9SAUR